MSNAVGLCRSQFRGYDALSSLRSTSTPSSACCTPRRQFDKQSVGLIQTADLERLVLFLKLTSGIPTVVTLLSLGVETPVLAFASWLASAKFRSRFPSYILLPAASCVA